MASTVVMGVPQSSRLSCPVGHTLPRSAASLFRSIFLVKIKKGRRFPLPAAPVFVVRAVPGAPYSQSPDMTVRTIGAPTRRENGRSLGPGRLDGAYPLGRTLAEEDRK